MKKALVFILAFVYLGVSSGIAMEIHYCMGKKAGVGFFGSDNEKCSRCGMKEKKGCCNDEHKFYKLSDSHKNVSNNLSFEMPVVAVTHLYPVIEVAPSSAFTNNQFSTRPPPVYNRRPACILNCIFRI